MTRDVLNRLRRAIRGIRDDGGRARESRRTAAFKLQYARFREILTLNDAVLELVAEIEDRLAGEKRIAIETIERRVRKAGLDVFLMVKNLNQISDNRHRDLYGALRRIVERSEAELTPRIGASPLPAVLALESLRARDSQRAGTKMANLGELAAECGLSIPPGFVITTSAFLRFMEEGGLWSRCDRLEEKLELNSSASFVAACREVQESILACAVPPDLEEAIRKTAEERFTDGDEIRLAVRSSAVGEDTASSSHAGLYRSELDVRRDEILAAYKRVLASAFSPTAVAYRFERGLEAGESMMAVGCVRMVRARTAGILYSRPPEDPEADRVVIAATRGIAARLAAGEEPGETSSVAPGREEAVASALLDVGELRLLVATARRLERHFRAPQDVEWAIDTEGKLYLLQSRPRVAAATARRADEPEIGSGAPPILAGGHSVFPGIASGPVFIAHDDEDLDRFPDGAVLVARRSSTSFVRIMGRCAAVLTDIGSPVGHMASLARELEVPTIVGMEAATTALTHGQIVTIDARNARVFAGRLAAAKSPRSSRLRDGARQTPDLERLRRIAALVTPLHLTDPASTRFCADGCESLHDITRYIHEKTYDVMFHFGDPAGADPVAAQLLKARLPFEVRVFDVGGGLAEGKERSRHVSPEDITSPPMSCFLTGLLEPRIRWDLPRPLSVRGFLSVLGESMAGPPSEAIEIGRTSYAIISDRYMNFSTKAGYHFSTVDCYCGRSQNRNYVHFRFNGGGAVKERRQRRVRFLSLILESMEFRVDTRGDLLTARLDKCSAKEILPRLESLGRLTLCARQLDMLMDSEASPEAFAGAFLAGEWHRF